MYNCFSTRVYLPGYYYSLIGFLSESFGFFKIYKKRTKKYNFRFKKIERIACLFVSKRANEGFAKKNPSALLIRSFIISDLSESLTVALFSWATRVICSQSLICPEKSERIAHSRSFDLSDEQISKFPTLLPSEFRKYIKLKKNFEKINFLKFKFFMYSIPKTIFYPFIVSLFL